MTDDDNENKAEPGFDDEATLDQTMMDIDLDALNKELDGDDQQGKDKKGKPKKEDQDSVEELLKKQKSLWNRVGINKLFKK